MQFKIILRVVMNKFKVNTMNNTMKILFVGIFFAGMNSPLMAEAGHEHGGSSHEQPVEKKHKEDDHKEDGHDEGGHDEGGHDEGGHDEGGHDEGGHKEEGHAHGGESDEEGITIADNKMMLGNITVKILNPRSFNQRIYAPAELKANGYTSFVVSPRVDSVVLRRHVALGDHVAKGDALVTLFSQEVAEAQTTYRLSNSEWQRTQKLGRKTIGEKRFVSAQIDYDAAYGRLFAYGLSTQAIESLTSLSTLQRQQLLGEYTLVAATKGVVLDDEFHQGQSLSAGEALMALTDESSLWVEARLTPSAQLNLPAGMLAEVKIGDETFGAKVVQAGHTIDPETRTRTVRLVIENTKHELHPGMFAEAYFIFNTEKPVLAVPETALMRGNDGDWTVFVETESNQFVAQEVELGRFLGKWREISGIKAGSRIVMTGAFFVASEIAKGGFDPHNH